jgi:ankyrin repeat protein
MLQRNDVDIKLIKELLDSGAIITDSDVTIAIESGSCERVKLIMGYINVANMSYYLMFRYMVIAIANEYEELALFLRNKFISCIKPIFSIAIDNNQFNLVKFLIESGGTNNNKTSNYGCITIEKENSAEIHKLLSLGSPSHSYECNHFHIAVGKSRLRIAKLLLDNRYSINDSSGCGLAPIFTAVYNDNLDAVNFLIDNGANVNITYNMWTPLHFAAFHGCHEIALLLIKKGLDINAAGPRGWTPLILASNLGHCEFVKLLLSYKHLKIEETNDHGFTAILLAIEKGYTDIVKLLINRANVFKCSKPVSLLDTAASQGNLEITTLLLKKGKSINNFNDKGVNALHSAIHGRYFKIVNLLLDWGVNINGPDTYFFSPLHRAVSNEDVKAIDLLLKRGANINMSSNSTYTPFYMATTSGKTNMMKLLIEKGADINIGTSIDTPFEAAIHTDKIDTVKILVENNAIYRKDFRHNFNHSAYYEKAVYLLNEGFRLHPSDLSLNLVPQAEAIRNPWKPITHQYFNKATKTGIHTLVKLSKKQCQINRLPKEILLVVCSFVAEVLMK